MAGFQGGQLGNDILYINTVYCLLCPNASPILKLLNMHSATPPSPSSRFSPALPRGYGEFVLFLDFDGVLHHENVLWHPEKGAYAGPPGFKLFEHVEVLERLLQPYPLIRIVLSTAWVRRYGVYGTAKRLSSDLRSRVIGATYHSKMVEAEFAEKPRGLQVLEDVWRRKPSQWIALDDTDEGWRAEDRSRVFITDERLGLSAPGAEDAIRLMLEHMHR